ncbi:MAG: zinc ribbon domain-containing protein [Candidatus Bathyarchaeia archaeon]
MPFCRKCGREVPQDARFCPYCGADQTSYTPLPPLAQVGLETKNTGLAAVLALVFGIFGLWGVGHIYVGKVGKGLAILVLGIVLQWILGFFVFFGMIFGGAYGSRPFGLSLLLGGLTGLIIWALVTIALFIWQIYDAYRLAKYYNNYVRQYGKAPW